MPIIIVVLNFIDSVFGEIAAGIPSCPADGLYCVIGAGGADVDPTDGSTNKSLAGTEITGTVLASDIDFSRDTFVLYHEMLEKWRIVENTNNPNMANSVPVAMILRIGADSRRRIINEHIPRNEINVLCAAIFIITEAKT
jgi:hypothetical protein